MAMAYPSSRWNFYACVGAIMLFLLWSVFIMYEKPTVASVPIRSGSDEEHTRNAARPPTTSLPCDKSECPHCTDCAVSAQPCESQDFPVHTLVRNFRFSGDSQTESSLYKEYESH